MRLIQTKRTGAGGVTIAVANSLVLLGSGSTMPHKGIALPLLVLLFRCEAPLPSASSRAEKIKPNQSSFPLRPNSRPQLLLFLLLPIFPTFAIILSDPAFSNTWSPWTLINAILGRRRLCQVISHTHAAGLRPSEDKTMSSRKSRGGMLLWWQSDDTDAKLIKKGWRRPETKLVL